MLYRSDWEIAHCKECGKLFHKRPGRDFCRECTAEISGEDSVTALGLDRGERDIAHLVAGATGLAEAEVRRAIQNIVPLKSAGSPELVCVRCAERPSLPDSDFCLHCQVDLHSSLGEAARDLFSKMIPPHQIHEVSSLSGVTSAIEDKRERAGSSHIRLTGGQRLKY